MIHEVVDAIIFVLNAFSVIILLVGVAKAIIDFIKNGSLSTTVGKS